MLFLFVDTFVMATDGFVAYRSNTISGLNTPKISYWNNTNSSGNGSFSGEVELATSGSPIRYVVLKQSPINSKIVLMTSSDDGNVDGYVCMKNCTNPSEWIFSSNIGNTSLSAILNRSFDFGFESNSGDVLFVYGVLSSNVSQDLAYRVLLNNETNFSLTNINYIDDGGHATDVQNLWVSIDSDPLNTSDEIIMAAFDDLNNDVNAWVWNGTAFGAINSITDTATATANREAHAVKYASDGSKGMVVAGNNTNGEFNSEYWDGSNWIILPTTDIDTADALDIQWLSLKADPSSDDLQLVAQDSGSDLGTAYWNGSTWN
ncbi:MAG TPA: hypothetical protein V6C58_22900, partial [Allocoleopsis sp.]